MGLAADADEVSSSKSDSEPSDDSRLAATKPPQESVKEHVVSGLEQVSSVDRGSTVELGHQHAGRSEKSKGKFEKGGKAEKRKRKKRKTVEEIKDPKGEDVSPG